MKSFYVYLITNTIINKQYVGSKVCYKDPYNDNYMGSSKYLKEDYKIFGKENFVKEIISVDYKNETDMLEAETFYILKYNTLTPNGYNRFTPNQRKGFHINGTQRTEETKQKISKSLRGKKRKPLTEEHKKKISENNKRGMLGKHQSNEAKEKLKLKNLGKILSEETKKRISNSTYGIKKPRHKGYSA
jgi:group I intron endonuclease